MATASDDIEDALTYVGLFVGYPAQRHALAADLAGRGFEADDVLTLWDWAQRSFTPSKRKGGLINVLQDTERATEVLGDVHRVSARQQQAAEKTHDRFKDREFKTPEEEQWSELDRAVAVATRVDVDMANKWRPLDGGQTHYLTDEEKLASVAAEFGIPDGLAAHLLAQGRQLHVFRRIRKPGGAASPEKAETAAERLARFKRFLADGRKSEETVA